MTPPPVPDLDTVHATLLRMFGTGVAVSVCRVPHVARAAEFDAGRRCAREALAQLGSTRPALIADGDGAPRWPAGFVGSISHSGGWAVAVAARRGEIAGVGVDCQRYRPGPAERLASCFVPEEAAWLESWEPSLRDHRAVALFTMKESAQKCVRSALDVLPPPERIAIRPDWRSGSFEAERIGPSAGPAWRGFQGAFAETSGLLLAGAVITATLPKPPSPDTPGTP